MASYSLPSGGTTEETTIASAEWKSTSLRDSRPEIRSASSSPVAPARVWKRQCSTSSSPSNAPRWVWVLPTSTPRSIRRLSPDRLRDRESHPLRDSRLPPGDGGPQDARAEGDRVQARGHDARDQPRGPEGDALPGRDDPLASAGGSKADRLPGHLESAGRGSARAAALPLRSRAAGEGGGGGVMGRAGPL